MKKHTIGSYGSRYKKGSPGTRDAGKRMAGKPRGTHGKYGGTGKMKAPRVPHGDFVTKRR